MALLDAGDARNQVVIALLKEEEWGVASYLDLVVRILAALAEEAPQLNADIASIYDKFSKDAEGAESLATGLLRQHSEGKTLLLFCENLMDLFQGLGDEGQKRWRAAIQEDGNWTIVATTPQLFAGISLQSNPFYGFFTVRPLEKIDLDTGIELLAKKAVHEDKSDLADYLRTPLGRARARAVHHLAAGNHRAYVVILTSSIKNHLRTWSTRSCIWSTTSRRTIRIECANCHLRSARSRGGVCDVSQAAKCGVERGRFRARRRIERTTWTPSWNSWVRGRLS